MDFRAFAILLLAAATLLSACGRPSLQEEGPASTTVIESRPKVPAAPPASPSPTATKTPEELKYGKDLRPSGPTPTPLPLAINAYGCHPAVLYTEADWPQAQLVVFLNKIVYEKMTLENVSFELNGEPAHDIEMLGVDLFEAQDLLVNFRVTPKTPLGQYDARIEIAGESFFLKRIFEVHRGP